MWPRDITWESRSLKTEQSGDGSYRKQDDLKQTRMSAKKRSNCIQNAEQISLFPPFPVHKKK
jgi:hypothetical protein